MVLLSFLYKIVPKKIAFSWLLAFSASYGNDSRTGWTTTRSAPCLPSSTLSAHAPWVLLEQWREEISCRSRASVFTWRSDLRQNPGNTSKLERCSSTYSNRPARKRQWCHKTLENTREHYSFSHYRGGEKDRACSQLICWSAMALLASDCS